jgi:hypothetical protein
MGNYLTEEFLNLDLMFLILDVEVVENFLLFGLSNIGVVVLCIKLSLPKLNLTVLLLDNLY